MSSEIGRSRSQLILSKLLGMDAFPPAPNLSPEIVPVIEIENVPPELRFLGGERLTVLSGAIAATVGNLAAVSIFNPASSGQVVVVERIEVSTNTEGLVQLSIGHTAGGSAGRNLFRDTRLLSFGGSNRGAASILVESVAAIGGAIAAEWYITANGLLTLEAPIVLGPNNATNQSILTISHDTVATPTLRVVAWTRERALPSVETVAG